MDMTELYLVLKAVYLHNNSVSFADLKQTLRWWDSKLRLYLREMRAMGLVRRIQNKYYLTDDGKKQLAILNRALEPEDLLPIAMEVRL